MVLAVEIQQIESVGIEVEVENTVADVDGELVRYFSSTYDRSCESDGLRLMGTNLTFGKINGLSFPYENVVLGGEYVSKILDTSDDSFFSPISNLTNKLDSLGESWTGNRASLHVHVCFQNPNLRMLKNALRLWKSLEDVFYLIGGMGFSFRGKENNSAYCRPLTGNGPIVVPTRRGYSHCINIEHLLQAKTLSEFWNKWGDLPTQLEREKKYYPVRYLGFNLGSAYKRGTIEFRVFNKTLNPLFIFAVIKFCKKFAGMAMGEILTTEDNGSVYYHRNKDDIAGSFLRFAEMSQLDSLSVKEIMKIIGRSELIYFPEEEYVRSHLQPQNIRTHWEEFAYFPEDLSDKDIITPAIDDLHHRRGER